MENNVVQIKENEILTRLEDSNLPKLITGHVEELKRLDKSVQQALTAASNAEKSAVEASKKSAGFGKKKVAIEELQSASVDLAKAVHQGAEAQKISFEFQQKLAEISKQLFALGVSNLANNRMVIRELEKRLQGASEEEISELAQQELMNVLHQLKAQEDILVKIDNHSLNIQQLRENLVQQFEYSRQLNEKFFEQKYRIEQFEDRFESSSVSNQKMHDTLNKDIQEILIEQHGISKKILEHKQIIMQFEERLKKLNELNEKLQGDLKKQNDIIDENTRKLNDLHSEQNSQGKQIEEQLKLFNQHEILLDHIKQNINKIQEINDEVQIQLKQFGEYHLSHEQAIQSFQNMKKLLDDKIENSKLLIEQNHNNIHQLQKEYEHLSKVIEKKSNLMITNISLGVGIIGTILAIIGLIF